MPALRSDSRACCADLKVSTCSSPRAARRGSVTARRQPRPLSTCDHLKTLTTALVSLPAPHAILIPDVTKGCPLKTTRTGASNKHDATCKADSSLKKVSPATWQRWSDVRSIVPKASNNISVSHGALRWLCTTHLPSVARLLARARARNACCAAGTLSDLPAHTLSADDCSARP